MPNLLLFIKVDEMVCWKFGSFCVLRHPHKFGGCLQVLAFLFSARCDDCRGMSEFLIEMREHQQSSRRLEMSLRHRQILFIWFRFIIRAKLKRKKRDFWTDKFKAIICMRFNFFSSQFSILIFNKIGRWSWSSVLSATAKWPIFSRIKFAKMVIFSSIKTPPLCRWIISLVKFAGHSSVLWRKQLK